MKDINAVGLLNKAIEESPLVLAVFSDMDCQVCLSIYPDLLELEAIHPQVNFITVKVNEVKEVVSDKHIFVYPTLIVYTMGKEAKRFERVFAMDEIKATLERYENLLDLES